MKRINLTENDIFNIVNKVIAEQVSNERPDPLTPDEEIKRFLYGDNSPRDKVKVPRVKDESFIIKQKRGLNKETFEFIVQDIEFIETDKGPSALVKGYRKGQKVPNTELTVFEYVCGRRGDFVLKEYEGINENDIKKQKTPKQPKDDLESSFKNNVKQGIGNLKQSQGVQNIKQGAQNIAQDVQGKVRQGLQNVKNKLKR